MKAQEEVAKKTTTPVLVFAILGFVAAVTGLGIQIVLAMIEFVLISDEAVIGQIEREWEIWQNKIGNREICYIHYRQCW